MTCESAVKKQKTNKNSNRKTAGGENQGARLSASPYQIGCKCNTVRGHDRSGWPRWGGLRQHQQSLKTTGLVQAVNGEGAVSTTCSTASSSTHLNLKDTRPHIGQTRQHVASRTTSSSPRRRPMRCCSPCLRRVVVLSQWTISAWRSVTAGVGKCVNVYVPLPATTRC